MCRHSSRNQNARGSTFWQCRAARSDTPLNRYPPLPVKNCHAFERPAATNGPSDSKDDNQRGLPNVTILYYEVTLRASDLWL